VQVGQSGLELALPTQIYAFVDERAEDLSIGPAAPLFYASCCYTRSSLICHFVSLPTNKIR
jgi:hypothetical protein